MTETFVLPESKAFDPAFRAMCLSEWNEHVNDVLGEEDGHSVTLGEEVTFEDFVMEVAFELVPA